MPPRSLLLAAALVSTVPLASPARATEAPAGATTPTFGPWQRVKDEQGIVVDRRTVSTTPLGEFRGTAVVEAPLERVFAVIRDADRRTEWMSNCVESRFVERGEQFQVLYNRTKAPWPAWDRDVVLHGTIRFDTAAKALWVLFESATHPSEPAREGVVRMPFLHGHWKLEPLEGNTKTRVEYLVHANPGGQLPVWIVNLVSGGLPFDTIRRLRLQVTKASYPEYEEAFRKREGYAEVVGLAPPAASAPSPAPAPEP